MAEQKVPTRVRFYRFKNRLKEKTAGLGVKEAKISPEALAQAEAALSAMAEDYPDWVMTLIQNLADYHRRCVDTPEMRKELFTDIAKIAHDMKGQGGTFGYQLITDFSDSLYNFVSGRDNKCSDGQVDLIKAHVDSMRAVIRGRVSGDGGAIGEELKKALQDSIERHAG